MAYTRNLWDNLELYNIESITFNALAKPQQQGAVALGLGKSTWDCFVNHYSGLYWEDLQVAGAAQHYEVLGWNQDAWDEDGTPPDTADTYWADLSVDQQEAAYNLCYWENSWNWISLDEW